MSTIDVLKAKIGDSNKGIMRSNRFRIEISGGGGASISSTVSLYCDSVNLPGRQIATTEHFVGMKAYKKPYGYINDDVTMTFLMTNDFTQWDYFKLWSNQIVSPYNALGNQHEVSYKEDYTREVSIYTMDINNKDTKCVKLLNAFPVTVNSVELAMANENATTQLTVMLAYDDWIDDNISYNP
tara:strand:- start:1280 stop:1828 length:549 start_codon:yes stop_codon:yes gene_type:complete